MSEELARKVWREAAVPHLSRKGLLALQKALLTDDSRLMQGGTTSPPPLQCVQDWPVESTCLVGWCAVEDLGGFGVAKVGEVEEQFAMFCFNVDAAMSEPAACRHLLNWYDETPREEMRQVLLREVVWALGQKG